MAQNGVCLHRMFLLTAILAMVAGCANTMRVTETPESLPKPPPTAAAVDQRQIVRICGLVNRPGEYDLPFNEGVRLMDAIAMAGGLSDKSAGRIILIRPTPGEEEPKIVRASIRKAQRDEQHNCLLAAGDVVSVESSQLDLSRFYPAWTKSIPPLF